MRTSTRVVLGLVLPLLIPSLAHAQAFPTLASAAPQGGQRGTTVSVAFTGDRLAGAAALVFDGAGLSATITGHTGQKMATFTGTGVSGDIPDAGRLAAEIVIAADAAVGVRFVRVSTPDGVSNALPFVVGDLPEVAETEPNNAVDAAQELWLPATVSGSVTSVDDEDYYRFAATAGSRILCAAVTTQTGSPLDPYLRLLGPDGEEVSTEGAGSSSIDHTITADGTYTLAIRDRRYQGSGRHTYRLSVGATPLLDEVFPLGGRRGVDGSVTVVGRNLSGISSIRVAVAPDAASGVRELRVTTEDGWTTNALPFAIGDLAEITETEPNGADGEANDIPTPVTINGRIGEDGDTDSFTFAVEAGQRLAMEVYAGRLGSKLDGLLTLTRAPMAPAMDQHPTDADTSEHPSEPAADAAQGDATDSAPLAVNDDARGADPRIDYTFTDTGRYTIAIRDLNGRGGSDFAYRLSVSPLRPDFSVAVNPAEGARPEVPTRGVARIAAGGSTPLAVDVSRADGFAGAVRFRCEGLPEGFSVDSALVEAGQTRGYITLTAPWDATPGLHSVSVVGVAAVGGQRVERVAGPNRVLLTVTPARPFTLSVAEAAITVQQGKDATLHVEGVRADGFSAPVALSVIGLPGLARASGASLAASENAAAVPLHAWTVPSRNPVVAVPRAGVQYITVKGSATIDGKPVAAYSRAVPFTIVEAPFIVNVEPIRQSFLLPALEAATSTDSTEGDEPAANADEGMAAEFAVEITRQGGFTDAASVAVTGLPEGLTASVATVPEHENSVTITLTASRSLETGEYPIRFTGKATVNGREFSQDSQSVVIKILR